MRGETAKGLNTRFAPVGTPIYDFVFPVLSQPQDPLIKLDPTGQQ